MSAATQQRSTSKHDNDLILPFPRNGRENILAWGERAVADMQTGDPASWTYIVLRGGDDTTSFRLRLAQAHLRSDMLPSYWSHSMLVRLAGDSLEGAQAVHVLLFLSGSLVFLRCLFGVVVLFFLVF